MIKNLFKYFLSQINLLKVFKGKKYIFVYHDVSESDSVQHSKYYSTTPEKFIKQLIFFQKNFKLISLDEIIKNDLSSRYNYASIVFDDGFKTIETIAFPILKQLNIPFSIFLNKNAIVNNRLWLTDVLLQRKPFYQSVCIDYNIANLSVEEKIDFLMNSNSFQNYIVNSNTEFDKFEQIYLNYKDVEYLKNNNIIVGSHTLTHPNLALISEKQITEELALNKVFLDNSFKQNTSHFAIPFGKKYHYPQNIFTISKNCGYDYIFTTKPTYFTNKVKHVFPRIGLTDQSVNDLKFLINRPFLIQTYE
jgi:peptidoglycan/xylan/chitin deacetylase (PgdA/CDA1 family)